MSSRSHPRPPTGVIGGAVAAGSVLVAGAVFAGAMTTGVARRMVGPGRRRTAVTAVLGVDPGAGRIRFAPTDDAALPGVYSFWFDEGRGHARVGRILERTPAAVTRELLGVDAGDITTAAEGRFNGWVYLSPEQLGVPWEDVRIQTTLGVVPAWEVPAEGFDSPRWAVLVHGRRTVRQEVLRAVPVFREAGWSTLLVSAARCHSSAAGSVRCSRARTSRSTPAAPRWWRGSRTSTCPCSCCTARTTASRRSASPAGSPPSGPTW
jgi:hypothetical protein